MSASVELFHGRFVVVSTSRAVLAGPFDTNAEAWRALDRLEGQPISPQEKIADFIWQKQVDGPS